jgi:hypothetical protein
MRICCRGIGRAGIGCLFAAALVTAIAAPAMGDSMSPPFSYAKPTPDGRHVFVMISPLSPQEEISSWNQETAAKIASVRKHYSRSGLYPNDNSTTPLWTVDWYAYDVEPLSDGVHLVRPGSWASSRDDLAISFLANGKLIRSYAVKDLVLFPSLLPHTVSHFFWERSSRLHDDDRTYEIVTLHGDRYVFDATTGEILSSRRPVLWAIGLFVLIVLGAVAFFFRRRAARRRERLAQDTGSRAT